jgi:hypothetical protein
LRERSFERGESFEGKKSGGEIFDKKRRDRILRKLRYQT